MVATVSFRIKLLVGGLIVAGVAIGMANQAGKNVADKQLEHFAYVWPDVKKMSQEERGMLSMLVWKCKLGNGNISTESVLRCLQHTMENDDLPLPNSMTREQLVRRIQTLQASPSPAARSIPSP